MTFLNFYRPALVI
uniref:Uncharacterized protein n=1 Tax=Arundo donax TaxID=35708 RepID=A0A0A8Y1R0_ARUDO